VKPNDPVSFKHKIINLTLCIDPNDDRDTWGTRWAIER
jgi:hypothetical protein